MNKNYFKLAVPALFVATSFQAMPIERDGLMMHPKGQQVLERLDQEDVDQNELLQKHRERIRENLKKYKPKVKKHKSDKLIARGLDGDKQEKRKGRIDARKKERAEKIQQKHLAKKEIREKKFAEKKCGVKPERRAFFQGKPFFVDQKTEVSVDKQNGTLKRPFQSLEQALAAFSKHAENAEATVPVRIILKEGSYTSENGLFTLPADKHVSLIGKGNVSIESPVVVDAAKETILFVEGVTLSTLKVNNSGILLVSHSTIGNLDAPEKDLLLAVNSTFTGAISVKNLQAVKASPVKEVAADSGKRKGFKRGLYGMHRMYGLLQNNPEKINRDVCFIDATTIQSLK